MKRIPSLILLSLCSILSFGQTLDYKSIDKLFADWDKEGAPGCALGIMKDGELIYSKGYGLANLEYDIPNSSKSVFRIASTSKQFTAACVVLLAEQGKLSLDDKLNQFFPEFPDYAKTISIRHLLNHTSGIRDYLTISYLKGLEDNDYYQNKDVMEWLINQKELNFNPGDEYLYSNSGYWLLGQIVNKVSGMDMANFAKQEIFDPLNMSSTHFHNNHNEIVKNRASGYTPIGGELYEISMTTLDMIGDGGIFTSIEDIKKWDDSYYDNSVLSKEFWDMMSQQGVLNNGEVLDYASGIGISEYNGLKVISHGAAFVGFRAEFIRFPDQQLSIAVFANRADANPTAISYQVADIMLKDNFENLQSDILNVEPESSYNAVTLLSSELNIHSGNYWNENSSLARKIYVKDDTLRYYRSPTSESSLVPISKNDFKMINVGADVDVKFYKDKEGQKVMSFAQNGSEPSISKIYEPKTYTKEELIDFEGLYYSKELDVEYSLKLQDESLVVLIDDNVVTSLNGVMENLFSVIGLGTVKFKRDKSGNVSEFLLAAGRVKNLVFKKK